MLKKGLLYLLFVLVLAIPLNVVSAESSSNDISNKVDFGYIDPKLPQKDQKILREVMQNLDKEDRENVFYIDENTGYFTANRTEKLNEYKAKYKDIIGSDGNLKHDVNYKENAQSVSALECEKIGLDATFSVASFANPTTPCNSADSGPFRKVVSTTGKSRITADLYLPAKGTEMVMSPKSITVDGKQTTTGDTAYIYVGALNTVGSVVHQVDAGLQFNYGDGVDPMYATEETWAMTSLDMGSVISGSPANFKMGTNAFMKFYIPANNQAALSVSGTAKDGSALTATMVWNVSATKGFTTSGSLMQVKRITSIAQLYKHEDLTTGSYMNNVQWNNVKVGTVSGSEQLMNASTTSSGCGYKTSNILVEWTSWAQEVIRVKTGTL
ncbi:hypothetical protein [Paenibacillus tianjinensis]|uniref:Uncharacterized protein n=1 Tax=Paenibacillus tianjinensis TaxID=2810347 RepID=A0ABX7L9T0_9BACL|nr:hypothetical protein [Paenibacillus tianjinensis]QSF44930.1 hypothetical protein JRJ22_27960 [Paenibacillus tianjinensis]